MIFKIAFIQFWGLPLVAWNGILTLILFFAVAFIGWAKFHGKLPKLSFFWHPGLAALALVSALIHATLALSIYLKF
ncbi:MAG: hypothetical protein WCT26_02090 [Candidatus Buchananbacteria bacterium]|jgi:hypothetical protein